MRLPFIGNRHVRGVATAFTSLKSILNVRRAWINRVEMVRWDEE
jgi:hypothetical protein